MPNTTIEPIEIRKIKGYKKRYELSVGDKLMILDFPARYKMNAVISIGSKTYSIKRTGWWKRYISIESNQSPFTNWKVQQRWNAGEEFRTEDNRVYRLKKGGFFSNKWHWLDEQDQPIIELKEYHWSISKKATAVFFSKVDDTVLWLTAVGWFLIICRQQDAAAAAVA